MLNTPGKAFDYADKDFYPNISILLRTMAMIPITSCECECFVSIKKYGSYFLSRDWAGLKWRPVLKVCEQLQDKHSKVMQNFSR